MRAYAHALAGDLGLAYKDALQAIEYDPHDLEAYRQLDYLLVRQRRFDEAIEHWNRFLALEPENARAYFERAGTYQRKGDMPNALADLERAADLGNEEAKELMERYR